MALEVGALCLAHSPTDSWTPARVTQWDGKLLSVKTEGGEVLHKLKEDDALVVGEDVLKEDVDDLLNLTLLHDGTLLYLLRARYLRDVIYTNIGAIVVALNPFNFKIPAYLDERMPDYLSEGDRIERNIPHSWAVAHNTYWELRNDEADQCILVSGESGAGKTEASKIVMKYLAALSCRNGEQQDKDAAAAVGTKINITSPPLEAFGNAKTVRNDNSSRFGKFMKVKFDSQGFLRGAFVIKYLLEKSRIVTCMKGERVYHSFYLLVRGAEEQYKLGPDTSYRSLNAGQTVNNKDFDTIEEYQEVNQSLERIGLEPDLVQSMWRSVAGMLHILNLDFDAVGEGSCIGAASAECLPLCCEQWQISQETFEAEANKTVMNIGGTSVTKLLPPAKAVDGRDALVKALYDEEFGWLIGKCNEMLDVPGQGNWVGLLDIFGFEDFEVNSFEQICINLANESLQNHYNNYIFTRDMEMCRAEGIDVTEVQFPDNEPCLLLVSGKGGILELLDAECSLGKGSDMGFLDNVVEKWKKHPFFLKKALAKDSFVVHHYAGSVSYSVQGVLDKNRDTLKDSYKHMMRASENRFIAGLLPDPADGGKKLTVGGFFKSQVRELLDLINSTNPHWIRCVKPHPAKKPLMFHGVSTMKQLASAGVLGTVKIRKAGYPIRLSYPSFKQRYRLIAQSAGCDSGDPHEIAQAAFQKCEFDKNKGQLGKSIVFMKSEGYVALEQQKKVCLAAFARTLVSAALCRISRHRMACERRHMSAEVIQRFCLSRPSEKEARLRAYELTKDSIIAAVKATLLAIREEESRRASIEAEEEAAIGLLRESDELAAIEQCWLAHKDQVYAAYHVDLVAAEAAARAALDAEEAACWEALPREMQLQMERRGEEARAAAERRREQRAHVRCVLAAGAARCHDARRRVTSTAPGDLSACEQVAAALAEAWAAKGGTVLDEIVANLRSAPDDADFKLSVLRTAMRERREVPAVQHLADAGCPRVGMATVFCATRDGTDLDRLLQIPGFPPAFSENRDAWRRYRERHAADRSRNAGRDPLRDSAGAACSLSGERPGPGADGSWEATQAELERWCKTVGLVSCVAAAPLRGASPRAHQASGDAVGRGVLYHPMRFESGSPAYAAWAALRPADSVCSAAVVSTTADADVAASFLALSEDAGEDNVLVEYTEVPHGVALWEYDQSLDCERDGEVLLPALQAFRVAADPAVGTAGETKALRVTLRYDRSLLEAEFVQQVSADAEEAERAFAAAERAAAQREAADAALVEMLDERAEDKDDRVAWLREQLLLAKESEAAAAVRCAQAAAELDDSAAQIEAEHDRQRRMREELRRLQAKGKWYQKQHAQHAAEHRDRVAELLEQLERLQQAIDSREEGTEHLARLAAASGHDHRPVAYDPPLSPPRERDATAGWGTWRRYAGPAAPAELSPRRAPHRVFPRGTAVVARRLGEDGLRHLNGATGVVLGLAPPPQQHRLLVQLDPPHGEMYPAPLQLLPDDLDALPPEPQPPAAAAPARAGARSAGQAQQGRSRPRPSLRHAAAR
eukprot:TRINITY_DN7507_c0_g1_i2.p1 TRINITY_DN7507_c0_g1~~TRINITY_DN7507_c0_g1_i2.p1  ORF type:complete len:1566 (+),score=503.08 TRINITY_DN7507_c0_g1_i2:72-4700(+)